jgi:hypothetical protein
VRRDTEDLDVHFLDRVCASDQLRGRRRHGGRVGEQIGADIGQQARAERQEASLWVDGKRRVPKEPPALVGGEEVLGTILDPLDGPGEPHRRDRGDGCLGRKWPLAPEGAADVPHDDADPLPGSSKHG